MKTAFAGIILVLVLTSTAFAARDREITVSGSCTRYATSDRGAIVLTAEFTDPEIKAAARKATEIYERTRDALKRLNLENADLKTTEYSVTEIREWEKNRSVSKGFRARMGLKISTSAIQKMGDVIAIAAREGVRDVGQLSTYLSDEKLKAEQIACLQEAAEHARMKAEKLAGSLGAKVGEIATLSETISGPEHRPMMMAESMSFRSKSADMAAPSVESGQQEINVSVQAIFSLK